MEAQIRPILQNKAIFGVDLYEVGMAKTVCNDFDCQLLRGIRRNPLRGIWHKRIGNADV